ncbi:MAG TPA: tRNA pseudouridine synthase A, partial [Chitinophagaceae bacterium]|nr:tRNA pseudouridine synthase A [Chitinophagaceae bacterium]
MPRYFIELSYKGTAFQGFQIQDKGITVQGEVNKTLQTYYRQPVQTTTSSRTDSGVHARQNFLHFDADFPIRQKDLFHLNCIIHPDIVFQNIYTCKADAHCRFDALSRSYSYFLERKKEPFLQELRYYFPFSLNPGILKETADIIQRTRNFQSFAKRNSDVTNYECHIYSSEWIVDEEKNL